MEVFIHVAGGICQTMMKNMVEIRGGGILRGVLRLLDM
jgi:hypothetical protein